VQTQITHTGSDPALQRDASDSGLQAGIDPGARRGIENYPGFCFAAVRWLQSSGLRIVGMHLDGEGLLTVKEFEQQRELGLRMMPAEQFATVSYDQLVKRCAAKRPTGHKALIVAMINDFPAFGITVGVAERFAELP
jgi:hypothetical protein